MAMSVGLRSAQPALLPLQPRQSPYTVPRLIMACVRASLQAYRLASAGTASARFLCEVAARPCFCGEGIARGVAQLMPVRAGVVGAALPELRKDVERKAGAAATAVRVGVRCVARKVGGFLGKLFGTAVGALFSPVGAIVGAAVGIAVGGLVAHLLFAWL
jgi:hypothetical protein